MFDVALTSSLNTTVRAAALDTTPMTRLPTAMQRSPRYRQLAAPLIGLFLVFAAPVQAQYQWRDAEGKMVFSDRPPPTATPNDRILRQPARSGAARAMDAEQQSSADGKGEVKATLDSEGKDNKDGKDKDKEPKTPQEKWQALQKAKAKTALEEAEKKAEEARQQRLSEDCGRMKSYRGTLESGARMTSMGVNGEREIMDDQKREAEMRRVRQDIAENCDRPAKASPSPTTPTKR